MIEIAKAKLAHVERVNEHEAGQEFQLAEFLNSLPDADEALGFYARTLLKDDEPIAVVGAWPMWPGVSRAWAVFTPVAKAHPLSLYKLAKRQVEYVFSRDSLHRLEAVVLSGHLPAQRLVRHLGFQREGTLTAYGPAGQDYHMFAKVMR